MRFAKPVLFFALLSVFSMFLSAEIVTNTQCSLENGPPVGTSIEQSNPTSCLVMLAQDAISGTGHSTATASGTLTSPVPGSPASMVGANFSASVFADPILGFTAPQTGGAIATGNASLTLYTTGPIRQGQIDLIESIGLSNGSDPPTFNTASVSVGSLTTTCFGSFAQGTACSGNFGSPTGISVSVHTAPFTLGQAFSFDEAFHLQADSDGNNIESGSANVQFQFRLLDADGSPVQLYIAPEPARLTLVGMGLALLAAFLCHKRRSRGCC